MHTNLRYLNFFQRAMIGALLGAFIGSFELWFFKFDIPHLWAAVAAGATYMSILAAFGRFQRVAAMTLLGGVSGLVASTIWWDIAVHTKDSFALAAITGICFGSLYIWVEAWQSR